MMRKAMLVAGFMFAGCGSEARTGQGPATPTPAEAAWVVSRVGSVRPEKPAECQVEWLTLPTAELFKKYELVGFVRIPDELDSPVDGQHPELRRQACRLGGDAVSGGESGPEAAVYAVLAQRPEGADPSAESDAPRRKKPDPPDGGCMADCLPSCRGHDGKYLRGCVSSCVLFCTKY